ncbi:MAG: HlyD family efflux transporter periplasmic adaptor subunit [Prevotellaceae bacterium]|nr:HlyD family efflux transporter periplasmic adaptor subunit [Prevotellaceae bacterium]
MKKTTLIALSAVIIASACTSKDKEYDATGTFEATEVIVSAEQNGKLMSFDVTEGSSVKAGQQVGLVDTVQLSLKALRMGATRDVYANQRPDMEKQIAVTRQQLATAEQEQARFTALVKEGAANRKQLDDAISAVNVLKRQLNAQISTLDNSTKSLNSQMTTADIQRHEIIDQLQKCHITSPINGVILEKYTEQGEFATIGKPLFKVADIENMFMRAYVTTAQLQNIKIGQRVVVMSDYGDGNRKSYNGTITWISDRSEFTPKTILTDDERADLVYAIKIAIKNDGNVKIGMYGEVKF